MGSLSKKRRLKEQPAVAETASATSAPPNTSTYYDQRRQMVVQLLYQPPQVEWPSAERLRAYPDDVRAALVQSLEKEQAFRHELTKTQQSNDFSLNKGAQTRAFLYRMAGLILAAGLAAWVLWLGAKLIMAGESGKGLAIMIGAATTLIGTSVWGHSSQARRQKRE